MRSFNLRVVVAHGAVHTNEIALQSFPPNKQRWVCIRYYDAYCTEPTVSIWIWLPQNCVKLCSIVGLGSRGPLPLFNSGQIKLGCELHYSKAIGRSWLIDDGSEIMKDSDVEKKAELIAISKRAWLFASRRHCDLEIWVHYDMVQVQIEMLLNLNLHFRTRTQKLQRCFNIQVITNINYTCDRCVKSVSSRDCE